MIPGLHILFDQLVRRVKETPELGGLDVLSYIRPSVRLATQQTTLAQLDTGESRIGGVPDVPPNFDWPRWRPIAPRKDRLGQPWEPASPTPLGFIAQLDLSDLQQVDELLPNTGWLYFFYDRHCEPWGYDPADRGCCRVIYANGDRRSLTRIDSPANADPDRPTSPARLETWPELTLPDASLLYTFDTPEWEAYFELCKSLIFDPKTPCHRLLGHPQIIQNPMELECQLASNGIYCGGGAADYKSEHAKALEAGAQDWRLLLQIDTDEEGPGWMWGDCGTIYFWIRKQDLAALRFDDVWLVFQCS